ncbi:MAG: glycosyltransferase family 2 protein [Clostridiales bacterium]|nr:glycosyltransferase family 2 protein [Clostridiales bacterium]
MDPKISVIIPVYNTEPWLRKCLDSVINQTLKEIEIICIDDGSTDKSGMILDEYAAKDSRFHVIHKSNGGLVNTRKTGLSAAQAAFICFIDSDDWVDQNMLENMYKAAIKTDADITINRGFFLENKNYSYLLKSAIPAGTYRDNDLIEKVYRKMMRIENGSTGIIGSLCVKLFRRSLLERQINAVDDRIKISEDEVCTFLCIAHAKTVTIIDEAYYHYRKSHDTSMTYKIHEDYFINLNLVYHTLKNGFLSADNHELLLNELKHFINRAVYTSTKYLFGTYGHRCSYGYLFPFQAINKGCRLLLYGAGIVGISYYRQLITTYFCSKIIWVDRNWEAISAHGLPVENPEEITKDMFDVAVIAILEKNTAQSIRTYLLEKNIPDENIIWHNPVIESI